MLSCHKILQLFLASIQKAITLAIIVMSQDITTIITILPSIQEAITLANIVMSQNITIHPDNDYSG